MFETIQLQPKSIIAVSGGVDSMVLLELARTKLQPDDFVVAHFNHRTRGEDEHLKDVEVIRSYCVQHGLRLEVGTREVNTNKSEAALRKDRYNFLSEIKCKYSCNTIITAHHQDDVIETMLMNILRGTKWRGLVSIEDSELLQRPLLGMSKADILKYAKAVHLNWVEDTTNADTSYLRNRVRGILSQNLTDSTRESLVGVYEKQLAVAENINEDIKIVLDSLESGLGYSAGLMTQMPYQVRSEILYDLLKNQQLNVDINKTLIFNTLHFVHTAKIGAKLSLDSESWMVMSQDYRFGFVKAQIPPS